MRVMCNTKRRLAIMLSTRPSVCVCVGVFLLRCLLLVVAVIVIIINFFFPVHIAYTVQSTIIIGVQYRL